MFIIGKLYFTKILDSDHCIILRKKFKNARHVLVTMARYVTHKNNLIAISGLSIFFFFGIWYTLSSKISDLLLLSEVKGKNSFLNYKMQACLLVEVIESTLVYLVERGFIIKVVQRLLGGGQKSSLGCNETIVNT